MVFLLSSMSKPYARQKPRGAGPTSKICGAKNSDETRRILLAALCPCRLREQSGFQSVHSVKPANVALLIGKFGGQIGFDNMFCQLLADDAAAEDQDIQIVVLDALVRGAGVVANSGANTVDF